MKQHFSVRSRPSLIVVSVLIVASIVAAGIMYARRSDAEATTSVKPAAKAIQSQFSFSGATGWRKGPANATSLALFSDDRSCFTSMEYKAGTIDVAATLQKQQDDLATSGVVVSQGGPVEASMQTNATTQRYELHQYSLSGGSEKLMGGLALGYIQLPKGYIEVQGHCNTAEQLPTVIPALQAYRYTPAQPSASVDGGGR